MCIYKTRSIKAVLLSSLNELFPVLFQILKSSRKTSAWHSSQFGLYLRYCWKGQEFVSYLGSCLHFCDQTIVETCYLMTGCKYFRIMCDRLVPLVWILCLPWQTFLLVCTSLVEFFRCVFLFQDSIEYNCGFSWPLLLSGPPWISVPTLKNAPSVIGPGFDGIFKCSGSNFENVFGRTRLKEHTWEPQSISSARLYHPVHDKRGMLCGLSCV